MPDDLTSILVGTAIIVAVVAAWAGTVAFVFWDTTERQLPGWKQLLWLALAVIPLLGLVVYLMARQPPEPLPAPPPEKGSEMPDRVTFFRPPPEGSPVRLPTIPGADYLRAADLNGQNLAARPAAGQVAWTLSVLEGPHAGQRFVLDRLPACIGRGAGCTIRLDHDRSISRRHAEIYQQAEGLRLRDLRSTHGTHLNGYKISDRDLKPGDRIRVGYSLLGLQREKEKG